MHKSISMTESDRDSSILPPEQRAIRDRCFHPSGTFIEFPEKDVEGSIAARFERIASLHQDRLAVQSGDCSMSYGELNRCANRVATAIFGAFGQIPEPVGVLCSHAAPVVAAILGILKAG
jgi:non-ribosomal peptide synthetase component F